MADDSTVSTVSTVNPLAAPPVFAGLNALLPPIQTQAPPSQISSPPQASPPQTSVPAPVPPVNNFGKILQIESGGRHFAPSGQVLTSPAGALGIAQIMPTTGPEAAKLAGLDWDPAKLANDPSYNAALGQAYYNKQLATFGDPSKAAAAYNAGPTAVQKAITKAATQGGVYTDYLPQETKNYVAKFNGASPASVKASPTAENSSPSNTVASPSNANGLYMLAMAQALAPHIKFTPVDYDPHKVQPVLKASS